MQSAEVRPTTLLVSAPLPSRGQLATKDFRRIGLGTARVADIIFKNDTPRHYIHIRGRQLAREESVRAT